MASQPRVVMHVDLDAFYVSVEVKKDPGLRGLPVIVGSDPEGGRGRGVVMACSYEARALGLRSGMPISRAYRLCPNGVYLRPDFDSYVKTSSAVMSYLKSQADSFEQVSIDEAFLDVSRRVSGAESATRLAQEIQAGVVRRFGLTCSIGIAQNKTSAKIASDMKKPNGVTVVPFGKAKSFLAPLSVSTVPGIGRKTREFLTTRGIGTIGDLQKVDGKQLVDWFGKGGVWLWGVVHGQEMLPVKERGIPKSLSVEHTFRDDVMDFNQVVRTAQDAASELVRRLKGQRLEFRTAGIKIRFAGFETHTRERSLPGFFSDEQALVPSLLGLMEEFKSTGRPIRLIGVRVSQLRKAVDRVESLTSWMEGETASD